MNSVHDSQGGPAASLADRPARNRAVAAAAQRTSGSDHPAGAGRMPAPALALPRRVASTAVIASPSARLTQDHMKTCSDEHQGTIAAMGHVTRQPADDRVPPAQLDA